MTSPKPVKILCLHGLGQTGDGLLKQLQPLIGSLPGHWQFIAPDAPNAMPGIRDFEYVGAGTVASLSSNKSKDSSSTSSSSSSSSEAKEKSKSLSLAIQGIAIQIAAQAEYDGDQKRPQESKWSDGKWSEIMESYLKSSQPLIDAVPQVKQIYEDWKNKGDGERDVEELWKKLEDLSGRKGRKFPRSFSIQGEGWKAKGEWIGYSTSLKLFAKVFKQHGPFDGCIGFSTGGQIGWCVQTLLTHSKALSGYPAFQPFPKNQPPFKFILTYSAIEFVEKNTGKLIRSYPPISTSNPKLITKLKENPKVLGDFDLLPSSHNSSGTGSVNSLSIWGGSDKSIPIFMMANLALSTVKSEINLVHPGQHEIYLKEDWLDLSRDWLKTVNGLGGDLKEIGNRKPNGALPLDTGIPKPKEKKEGSGSESGKGRL